MSTIQFSTVGRAPALVLVGAFALPSAAWAQAGRGGGGGNGDPSEVNIRNAFTPLFTTYLRDDLDYTLDDAYYILGGGIGPWHYPQSNGYASVTPNLERAFAKNPATTVIDGALTH